MILIERIESIDHAITVAELAVLLHLGKTALYDMMRRGVIPHYRVSGLRFDPQEIADWLRNRSIKSPDRKRPKR